MRNVTVKYLRKNPRTGSFEYRRRVPKALSGVVSKREFLKVIGKSEAEAMMFYGREHERVEHLISLAKHGVTGLSPAEQRIRLEALLVEWEADPASSGFDENERTWREVEAERLVGHYQDPLRGDYIGVPEGDAELAKALLGGVAKEAAKVTVTDAFKAYLVEHEKSLLGDRKKQAQRFRRAEKNVIAALKGDRPISEVTRADSRSWRDLRLSSGVSAATIRRERNDIGAVFSWAISEMDGADANNPFSGMKLKAPENRIDQRLSLDQSTIDAVYCDLINKKGELHIWTLLDYTGARSSEIRMLMADEVIIDHDIPHIIIQERPDRTLKNAWSAREVPLIGLALETAKVILKGKAGKDYLFPHYASAGGQDRLSQFLNRRIRRYTTDTKHVAHSLRHNMADRMRRAEVFNETRKAIQGYAYSAGQDGSYGGRFPLCQLEAALKDALSGYVKSRWN